MCGTRARRASRSVVLVTTLLAVFAGCGMPPAADAPPPVASPPLDPNPPPQIEFPPDKPETADANLDREAVSRFAWKTFVALNWPARANGPRGTPDPDNRFRDTSGPTVWATWKSQDQLYPDDAKPKPWDDDDTVPSVGVFDKEWRRKQYQLREHAGAGAGRVKVLGQLTAVNQAVQFAGEGGAPLVDQNGKLVRYEVRINRAAYDTIFTKKYYLREELKKLSENEGVFRDGSINIKAAWKELPDDKAVRDRYYHTKALVLVDWNLDRSPRTEERVVGLVGLHIVYKVHDRNSWVWSTFEHVDNLTPPPGATVASFRNPALTVDDNMPVALRIEAGDPFPTKPVQVGRKEPINNDIKKVNDAYQLHPGLAGTPWKYYQLVGVQWAREKGMDGVLVDSGDKRATKRMLPPRPEPVVNVTMETFQPRSSCLSCHGPSVGEDKRRFLFVFYPDFLAIPQL